MFWTITLLLTASIASTSPSSMKYFNIEPAKPAEETQAPIESNYKLSYADYSVTWQTFKQKFNKVYENDDDENKRFGIFMENVHFIEYHNWQYHNKRSTFYLDINQFTDLTNDEFRELNGLMKEDDGRVRNFQCQPYEAVLRPLPEEIDWRTKGYVTAVKDQGQCNCSWAFSTTGAVEGQYYARHGKLIKLSEQQLIDCSTSFGNQGCNGGLMDFGYEYITASNGIESEESYPFEAKDDVCRFNPQDVSARVYGCKLAQGYRGEDEEYALQEAIANIGPISVGIDASGSTFQFYRGGIYVNSHCRPYDLNLGGLAVGYGSSSGIGFWVVKNSWGEDWGEGGYIRMYRDGKNQCGVASWPTFPIV